VVMPTDEKLLVGVREDLSVLMENARVKNEVISDNNLNHISKKYGVNLNEIYEIMYKISKAVFPVDHNLLVMWMPEERSDT